MENQRVEMPLSVFSDLQKVVKEITATQKIGGVVPRPILIRLKKLLLQIIENQKEIYKTIAEAKKKTDEADKMTKKTEDELHELRKAIGLDCQ